MPETNRPPARGGTMPAGLEVPPRQYPADPQHLDIRQTYDPRVSAQLDRTKRDLASGKPGSAALEDLERGATPLAPVEGEGEQPRETVVTFSTQFASYFAGESAAFTVDEAARLADLGVTGEAGPPATEAPVVVDVPYVGQAGNVLSCTMGNWEGTPTSYAYQWQLDGADIGATGATYTAQAGDVGKSATCIVTATNAIGSTAAPPSNAVVIQGT